MLGSPLRTDLESQLRTGSPDFVFDRFAEVKLEALFNPDQSPGLT